MPPTARTRRRASLLVACLTASPLAIVLTASSSAGVPEGVASITAVRSSSAAQHPRRKATYSPAVLAIHAPRAWKHSTGHGVTIAVIDTGVAGDVTNLRGRVLPGTDLVEPGSPNGWRDEAPVGGHGTGVASVIAGSGRGIPVHGIAPGVRILPVRIIGANGVCPDARVAEAIVWATRQGADVINLSIGTAAADISDRDKRREHDAVRFAVSHGVTVVAGAGNDGPHNGRFYPAAFPEVIAVGGTNAGGTEPASFSDRGTWIDVVAPAIEVWNANVDGTLGRASGTSFAAPAVSATAALLLSADPGLDPSDVRRLIMASASDLGSAGLDRETGAGLVDAARAVVAAVRQR